MYFIRPLYLLLLVAFLFSCKSNDSIVPSLRCKPTSYRINLLNPYVEMWATLTYDSGKKLINHKLISNSSSQPGGWAGPGGFKDSLVYKGQVLDKIYHFSQQSTLFQLDIIRYFSYENNKVKSIREERTYYGQHLYSTKTILLYYIGEQLTTSTSQTRRYTFKSATIPNMTDIPDGSYLDRVDTTTYTYDKQNLSKELTSFYEYWNAAIGPTYRGKQEITYEGYNDKINPFYQLPILVNGFNQYSKNNFTTKTVTNINPNNARFVESQITEVYTYNADGFPISLSSSTIGDASNKPFFIYNCD